MWSPAVTTVAPAAEPLLLPAVKEFLRVDADDTTFDTELGGYIAGARADAEAITGTRLITQCVELRADCFADLLHLPIGPVQSISSFTYLDAAGVVQTLVEDTDFELFGAGLEQGLRPMFGGTWPAGAIRASSIVVTVAVGYGAAGTALPQDLYVALLRAVRGLFDGKPLDLAPLLANHRIWI
jgi:uncharacterized phiE125 gp8 family phage protein